MSLLVDNTPIDHYRLNGHTVYVKREDLCSPEPGPSFSKIRGVYAHIQARTESIIGVLDTKHSKAGWAVSYVCKHLGKQAFNFWPRYVSEEPGQLRFAQRQAEALGARMVELKAGRSCILYHQAKQFMYWGEYFPIDDAYMMPNALKLPESVTENAAEAERTLPELPSINTVVLSVSSGTVAAGVIKGLGAERFNYVLHMGYNRSEEALRAYVESKAGAVFGDNLVFVNEGYGYADAAPRGATAPFPCNPFYDLKAWHWLGENVSTLAQPVLFWNIGA